MNYRLIYLGFVIICLLGLIGCSDDNPIQTNVNESTKYTEQDKQEAKKITKEIFSVFEKGKEVKNQDVDALMNYFSKDVLTMSSRGKQPIIDQVINHMAEQDPLLENPPYVGLVEEGEKITIVEEEHSPNGGDLPTNLVSYNGTERFEVVFIKKDNKLWVVHAGVR